MTNLDKSYKSYADFCEVVGFDDIAVGEYLQLSKEELREELLCGYGIEPDDEFEE